jgi:CrcB protein
MSVDVASVALVAAGGAIGAAARYVVGRFTRRTVFVVNVSGSLLLGVTLSAAVGDSAALVLGVGLCGSFTTFSSFALETVTRAEERPLEAAGYAVGTLAAAVGAFLLGGYLAGAL